MATMGCYHRGLECEQTTPQQATANQSTSILPSAAAEGTANKQEDASKSDDVVEATDEYQRENASHQVTSETCDDELDQRPSVETNATEDAEADDSGRTSDLVVESNTQQTVEPVSITLRRSVSMVWYNSLVTMTVGHLECYQRRLEKI